MGDMADDAYDKIFLDEHDNIISIQDIIDENAIAGYWETQDGRLIKFNEIESKHKINIINWCERHGLIAPKQLKEQTNIKGE